MLELTDKTVILSASACVMFLTCAKIGRGPLEMLHIGIIHARAFLLWTRKHLPRGIAAEWRFYKNCVAHIEGRTNGNG